MWANVDIWAMFSLTFSWDIFPPEAKVWGELEVVSRRASHVLGARCFVG